QANVGGPVRAILMTPRAMGTGFTGGMGDLAGGTFLSIGGAVSAGGTVATGWGSPADGGSAFRWTLAGTAAYIGMLGITLVELPINKQTLDVSLDTPPADWPATRMRWEYFNRLRTLCEVIGWGCLYLGSAVESRDA
ncbi:MAG: hypothetical protein H7Z42_12810, partial [Roseiflexaceae bacterium]|nr:hypothetical protein [Roseiflexaceae bacterium]